jgi:putative hydrolase of the HAD superfamily
VARNRLPCFAFTNSNPTHQAEWETVFPQVVASFDRVFVSSELGLRKPDYAAFDAIAQATGIALSSMLFFDDTLDNITGALNAGLQAIHVRTPMDVKRALVAIGVLP